MNLLQALRQGMISFRAKSSNNNRKMTPGRVADGKSTFKGTEAEHRLVRVEKKIKELSRMLFAVDIKIDGAIGGFHKKELKREAQYLREDLDSWMNLLSEISSTNRYRKFLNQLDQEDSLRRAKRGLEVA